MRPVSISGFIEIIHAGDPNPPAESTIRRLCAQKDDQGRPMIPGAYKLGSPWKIDLDVYIPEMTRRARGLSATEETLVDEEEDALIDQLAAKLAS